MAYSGSGTQADPFLVGTINDFVSVLTNESLTDIHIKMTADLDWTGRSAISFGNRNASFRSRLYIDGNGTSWTNITVINSKLFQYTGSAFSYISIFMSNFTSIEVLQIINNEVAWNSNRPPGWFINVSNGFVLTDVNMYIKLYWIIFSLSGRAPEVVGICIGPNNDLQDSTMDVMLRSNLVIDYYAIGTYGIFTIAGLNSDRSADRYIRDSIIKVSYYDENGWACDQQYSNFISNSDSITSNNYVPLLGLSTTNEYYYKGAILVNSGYFVRYYADVNMNDKVCCEILRYVEVVNSYIVYECMKGLYLRPRISKVRFSTYAFYDITKSPDMYCFLCDYSYGASQFAGLTTSQCKSRSSFEGPDAIIPFKLKQVTPGS